MSQLPILSRKPPTLLLARTQGSPDTCRMFPLPVVGYVIAAILAVQRSLALCIIGIVAVIRARREDIPAVMGALAQGLASRGNADHAQLVGED